MKRGEIVSASIDSAAFEGKGVARIDGYVLFVQGAVPGDRVRVRVLTAKKNYAEAQLLEVTHPSPLRTNPRCRHFGTCGGCRWQHVDYAAQLEFKRQHVADALERIGGFAAIAVRETLGAREQYYYRNKMEFSFGDRWRTPEEMGGTTDTVTAGGEHSRFALGLHIPGRFDRVLDITECYLQSETSVQIVNAVRHYCLAHDLPIYSGLTHAGYLRNLVIRESRRTGERMVNLVTRDDRPEIMAPLTAYLLDVCGPITTIVNNVTERKSQVAVGEYERIYHGNGTITERIGRRSYQISANSFFQTNTDQAERLYDTAKTMAQLQPGDVVYDLYSGTGTIALHVADDAREVIGIEAIESAVKDAQKNASSNGVSNCRFLLGDLKETLLLSRREGGSLTPPDVVIVDPPRAGMHEKVAREIRALRPRRIVYISCNPATQARDVKILCETSSYLIDAVQPVDMFPHTYHIENVLALARTD